jgi:hypothetical protein
MISKFVAALSINLLLGSSLVYAEKLRVNSMQKALNRFVRQFTGEIHSTVIAQKWTLRKQLPRLGTFGIA